MDRIESCADVRAALPLFVGGDLDPMPLEDAARHLEACPACAAELARVRRAREALLLARSEEDAPELWPAIREALRSEGRLAGSGVARRRLASYRGRVAALAATLLIAVGLWSALTPERTRPGAPAPAIGPEAAAPGAGELALGGAPEGRSPAGVPVQPVSLGTGGAPLLGAACPEEETAPAVLRTVPLHLASDQRLPDRRGPVWFFDPDRLDPLPPRVLRPADGARAASLERGP